MSCGPSNYVSLKWSGSVLERERERQAWFEISGECGMYKWKESVTKK